MYPSSFPRVKHCSVLLWDDKYTVLYLAAFAELKQLFKKTKKMVFKKTEGYTPEIFQHACISFSS